MKAKDMFKKLGWKQTKHKDLITYEDQRDTYYIIDFYLDDKNYECFDNYGEITQINNDEINEAILKQLEELGWR